MLSLINPMLLYSTSDIDAMLSSYFIFVCSIGCPMVKLIEFIRDNLEVHFAGKNTFGLLDCDLGLGNGFSICIPPGRAEIIFLLCHFIRLYRNASCFPGSPDYANLL